MLLLFKALQYTFSLEALSIFLIGLSMNSPRILFHRKIGAFLRLGKAPGFCRLAHAVASAPNGLHDYYLFSQNMEGDK
jgi:hypothetical protein